MSKMFVLNPNPDANWSSYLQRIDDNIYSIGSIQKNSLSNYSINFNKLSNEELEVIKKRN